MKEELKQSETAKCISNFVKEGIKHIKWDFKDNVDERKFSIQYTEMK